MPAHRVPTEVLSLRGAFKNHPERARPDEPEAVGEVGDPPDRLDESDVLAWETIVSECAPGVLCRSDRIAVEIAAILLAEKWELKRVFPKEKLVELRHYLQAFGMLPADRSRVMVKKAQKKSRLLEVLSGDRKSA